LEWRKVKPKQEEFDLWVPRDVIYVTEFINKLFKSEKPMQMLEEAESMLTHFSGMKSIKSSQSAFDSLFDSGDDLQDVDDGEYTSEQVEAAEDFLSNLEETNG
jgi:ethanolamine utilization protein EutQ (cupin superfamily)